MNDIKQTEELDELTKLKIENFAIQSVYDNDSTTTARLKDLEDELLTLSHQLPERHGSDCRPVTAYMNLGEEEGTRAKKILEYFHERLTHYENIYLRHFGIDPIHLAEVNNLTQSDPLHCAMRLLRGMSYTDFIKTYNVNDEEIVLYGHICSTLLSVINGGDRHDGLRKLNTGFLNIRDLERKRAQEHEAMLDGEVAKYVKLYDINDGHCRDGYVKVMDKAKELATRFDWNNDRRTFFFDTFRNQLAAVDVKFIESNPSIVEILRSIEFNRLPFTELVRAVMDLYRKRNTTAVKKEYGFTIKPFRAVNEMVMRIEQLDVMSKKTT